MLKFRSCKYKKVDMLIVLQKVVNLFTADEIILIDV